jgi:purine-binding chemotaxis protein CheW
VTGSDASATSATSAGGWQALAREASLRGEDGTDPIVPRQLLRFELCGACYAIPLERIREIVRLRPITPVPRAPDVVRGVIALRGEIVQVIDLRVRLSLPAASPTKSSRILIVLGEEGQVAGILVDAVTEVMRVPDEALRPATGGETETVEALCLSGDTFVSLMDLDRILRSGDED